MCVHVCACARVRACVHGWMLWGSVVVSPSVGRVFTRVSRLTVLDCIIPFLYCTCSAASLWEVERRERWSGGPISWDKSAGSDDTVSVPIRFRHLPTGGYLVWMPVSPCGHRGCYGRPLSLSSSSASPRHNTQSLKTPSPVWTLAAPTLSCRAWCRVVLTQAPEEDDSIAGLFTPASRRRASVHPGMRAPALVNPSLALCVVPAKKLSEEPFRLVLVSGDWNPSPTHGLVATRTELPALKAREHDRVGNRGR